MNPGISEEAGLTARVLVEALKSSPATLALVLFNLAFIGVIAYTSHSNHERWKELVEITLRACTTAKEASP